MSDLSLIPLQDGFETQLSQDWDGNTGTVYVLATPSYTPTTTNTYIVVNPGKTNMQIAEVTDYDSTAKTLTVSSISFEKGLGISSTAQDHSTGSKVIISDNYQFWEDIQTAINSKLDKNGGNTAVYASTALRDAALGGNGVATLPYSDIYVTATGLFYNYNLSTAQWESVDSGTTQGNASTSASGVIRTDVAPSGIPVALITDNPKYDALAGTSGTPSSTNKYVTSDDVAENTASKAVRRKSDLNITVPTTPTATTDASSKSYVDAISQKTYPLGESFTGATTPQAAVVIDDLFQSVFVAAERLGTTSSGADYATKRAVKFIPRASVTSSSVYALLGKENSPTDNLFITIETESAGNPSGTPITNGTSNNIAGASLSETAATWTNITFASAFTLSAGTTYYLVFQRSGATSDTNYFYVGCSDDSTDYASFDGRSYNGASWNNASPEIPMFNMIPSSGNGSKSLWKSDSDHASGMMQQVHGFCVTTGSAGDSGTMYVSGNIPGFTSLIPYTNYFLTSTAGTISLTGDGISVGEPINSTTLSLPSNRIGSRIAGGILSTTGGLSENNAAGCRFPIAMNGDLIVSLTGATALTVSVADSADMSTRNRNYVLTMTGGVLTSPMTIPVRKGQFVSMTNVSTGSASVTFIPIY